MTDSTSTPARMTPERAAWLLDGPRDPFGRRTLRALTDADRLPVLCLWATMPGHTCMRDVLNRIAAGGGA